ncbi:hypothetical protein [Maritalea sp.]|uniref:hypothetical protein n=1 Tax=Maritalea sp. TaxID=2003361 RepID=UPI003EF5E4DB
MNINKWIAALVAGAASLIFGTAAFAQGDLVFKHNGSPYFLYSNLAPCQAEHEGNANYCDQMGSKVSYCDIYMFSTRSVSEVAKLRWGRGDSVKVYHTGTSNVACNITP